MASKRAKKKTPSKIPPKTAERIVAIALQNPELGARRLVPLLKKMRIAVSATSIQNILRRNGLQTRQKRLAKLKERPKKIRKPGGAPKKLAARISSAVAERIVRISLQHPDFGARRLVPLLRKEKIRLPASTVYSLLRRHGLQSRSQRLAAQAKRHKKVPKSSARPTKPVGRISDEAADRICELALKNPELGAKRLLPLLQKQEISASSASVYRILKRRGLQTRQKRLAEAAKAAAEPVIFPKKFPDGIPPAIQSRIVDLSLQNPDWGARRLVRLLQQEEVFVSASAVYAILKRNGIENRPKRLLRIKAQQAAEPSPAPAAGETEPLAELLEMERTPVVDGVPEPISEPEEPVAIPPAAEAPVAEEPTEPKPAPAIVFPPVTERPPLRKAPLKPTRKRSPWVFYALYLLLFVLIGYLGFHAVQAIQVARLENRAVEASVPAELTPPAQPEVSGRPLSDYRIIWQRDLFSITAAADKEAQNKILLEQIALAPKNLGLELVGTVVADDPKMSVAIIDNRKTREQEAYREGDDAGSVKIKKILRNNVVITTAKGDGLLTVEIKDTARSAAAATPAIDLGSRPSSMQQMPRSTGSLARTRSITLKHQEVEASLSDIDALLNKVRLTPYMQGDQPSGFRISNIPADSVLRKMGLRSRDVIVGVDDDRITGPDQAADFFQKLVTGNEVTISVKRRRRTRKITLNFE